MESDSLSPLNLMLLPTHFTLSALSLSLSGMLQGEPFIFIFHHHLLSLLILLQSSYILSRFMNRALCVIDNASFAIDCVSF